MKTKWAKFVLLVSVSYVMNKTLSITTTYHAVYCLITAYLNNWNQCAQCVIHGRITPEFSHYGSYRIILICLK